MHLSKKKEIGSPIDPRIGLDKQGRLQVPKIGTDSNWTIEIGTYHVKTGSR